jgi:hypothetical protein
VAPARPQGGDGTGRSSGASLAATPAQLGYLARLVADRAWQDRAPARVAATCERLAAGEVIGKRDASEAIDALTACPWRPREAPAAPVALPDVPAGHYAITSGGRNDLLFVRVDRPTSGKWAGRTFVKMMVGGHPDTAIARDRVPDVLGRIVAAGVREAATLYGQQIGRCCACNRMLTDQASREAGIGPDCASRL